MTMSPEPPRPNFVQDYRRPWCAVEQHSRILIKDADGQLVLMFPFTGDLSKDRKRRVAEILLLSVNH
jgi:hypothetical protein